MTLQWDKWEGEEAYGTIHNDRVAVVRLDTLTGKWISIIDNRTLNGTHSGSVAAAERCERVLTSK